MHVQTIEMERHAAPSHITMNRRRESHLREFSLEHPHGTVQILRQEINLFRCKWQAFVPVQSDLLLQELLVPFHEKGDFVVDVDIHKVVEAEHLLPLCEKWHPDFGDLRVIPGDPVHDR